MRITRFFAAALVAGSLLPVAAMAQNATPANAAQAEKAAPKTHKAQMKHHARHHVRKVKADKTAPIAAPAPQVTKDAPATAKH